MARDILFDMLVRVQVSTIKEAFDNANKSMHVTGDMKEWKDTAGNPSLFNTPNESLFFILMHLVSNSHFRDRIQHRCRSKPKFEKFMEALMSGFDKLLLGLAASGQKAATKEDKQFQRHEDYVAWACDQYLNL